MSALNEVTGHARQELAKAIVGQREPIDLLLLTVVCGGHALLEGVPGLAKTLAVRSLATILRLQFHRVQCTPDLMPADIIGSNVFNLSSSSFTLHKGPVFTDLLLVDEINRMPPRTQAALLEAMEERQVTIDGVSHRLPDSFATFATQNPVEFEGTYPLPEAQVDRFMTRLSLGYPSAGAEVAMLRAHEGGDRVEDVEPVAGAADLLLVQDAARRVYASDALRTYVVSLLARTREDTRVELGASPRAGLLLLRAAKARALLHGRDHALVDDVQALATVVLAHRIVLAPEAMDITGERVVADALATTPAL